MSDVMLAAARKLGQVAARLGHPVTACPYNPGSGDAVQRAAARAYVDEWLRWRPAAAAAVDVDDVDDQADGEVARHLPGRHNQGTHGNRFKVPGDRASGLRIEGKARKAHSHGAGEHQHADAEGAAAEGKPAAAPKRKAAAGGKPAAATPPHPFDVDDDDTAAKAAAMDAYTTKYRQVADERRAAQADELTEAVRPIVERVDALDPDTGDVESAIKGVPRDQLVAIGRHYGIGRETDDLEQNRVKLGYGRKELARRIEEKRRGAQPPAAAAAPSPAAAAAAADDPPLTKALANAARRRQESKAAATELTLDGAETAFVPGARSTIGLGDRPNVGRDTAPAAQQLGMFDVADQRQMQGQGALLDEFFGQAGDLGDLFEQAKGGKRR